MVAELLTSAELIIYNLILTITVLDTLPRNKYTAHEWKVMALSTELINADITAPKFPGSAAGTDNGSVAGKAEVDLTKDKQLDEPTKFGDSKLQARLHAPKATFNGNASEFKSWKRSILIWKRQLTMNETLTQHEDTLLGTVLLESVKGAALTLVFARVTEGGETFSGIMSALEDGYSVGNVPTTLLHYRTFRDITRKQGTKLREFLNLYTNARTKASATGEEVDGITSGLVLLEKASLSPTHHATVLRHCEANAHVTNGYPNYTEVYKQLLLIADVFENSAGQSDAGQKGGGKGAKGITAFFTHGASGYDPISETYDKWPGKGPEKAHDAYYGTNDKGKHGKGKKGKGGKYGKGQEKGGGKYGKYGKGGGKYGKYEQPYNGKGKGLEVKQAYPAKGKGTGKGKSQTYGKSAPVCWSYQTNGFCEYGKTCKFSHQSGGQDNKRQAPGRTAMVTEIEDVTEDSDEEPQKKKRKKGT